LKVHDSVNSYSFIPFELLSINQIGQCIHPKLETCHEIADGVIKKTKGKKAQKKLIERFEREDHESFAAVQAYEEEKGTVPPPE